MQPPDSTVHNPLLFTVTGASAFMFSTSLSLVSLSFLSLSSLEFFDFLSLSPLVFFQYLLDFGISVISILHFNVSLCFTLGDSLSLEDEDDSSSISLSELSKLLFSTGGGCFTFLCLDSMVIGTICGHLHFLCPALCALSGVFDSVLLLLLDDSSEDDSYILLLLFPGVIKNICKIFFLLNFLSNFYENFQSPVHSIYSIPKYFIFTYCTLYNTPRLQFTYFTLLYSTYLCAFKATASDCLLSL